MAEAATQVVPDQARSVIESIYEKNRAFYSDPRGKGALKDLQQTFPNTWLYLAELLQNAVDEHADRIAIDVQNDNSLIFEHNGKPTAVSQGSWAIRCASCVSDLKFTRPASVSV
jgi:hypothetical protein